MAGNLLPSEAAMNEPPRPPNLPSVLAPLWRYLQTLTDWLRSNRLASVDGGEIQQTPRGISIVVSRAARQTGRGGLTFAGEYDAVRRLECRKDEIYVVFGGANQGTYVCLKDAPSRDPWEGVDWVALPMGAHVGEWL